MSKFLYGLSVQGIGEYIFSSNALKEIIGASELIKNTIDEIDKEIIGTKNTIDENDLNEADKIDLKAIFGLENEPPEVILSAAGHLRVIFENEADLKKIVREMPKFIAKKAGDIAVAQAVVEFEENSNVNLSVNSLENSSQNDAKNSNANLSQNLNKMSSVNLSSNLNQNLNSKSQNLNQNLNRNDTKNLSVNSPENLNQNANSQSQNSNQNSSQNPNSQNQNLIQDSNLKSQNSTKNSNANLIQNYKNAVQELENRLKIQRNKPQFSQNYAFSILQKYPKSAKPIFCYEQNGKFLSLKMMIKTAQISIKPRF